MINDQIKLSYYYKGKNGTPLVNAIRVDIGKVSLWFSYETLIAFRNQNGVLQISENIWGQTTGRHIRTIYNGEYVPLPRERFEESANEMIEELNLGVNIYE